MSSLTDIYNRISAQDAGLLEKRAAIIKEAEEQDAAGRIMARGFADELHKIAQTFGGAPSGNIGGPAETIKSGPYRTGGTDTKTQGRMGEGPVVMSRKSKAPTPAFKSEGALASWMGKSQKARHPSRQPTTGPSAQRPPMMANLPFGLGRKPSV
jgi:hypothetical protein